MNKKRLFRSSWVLLVTGLLFGCAGTYKPPAGQSVADLRVELNAKEGIPVISYSDVVLHARQVRKGTGSGIDSFIHIPLWWQKIDPNKPEQNRFLLPSGEPINLTISYRSNQLFGPTLSGSGGYTLVPEEGKSYLMRFWADKKQFSVDIFEETDAGELKRARAIVDNGLM